MFLDKERSLLGMGAAITFHDFLFLEVSLSSTSDLPTKRKANRQQKAKDVFYFILFIYFFIFQNLFVSTLFRSFWEGFILVATKTDAHSHPQRASQMQLRKNHHSF